MLSIPPAAMRSASPRAIVWAASITALRPEAQTLLMVVAGTVGGRPAARYCGKVEVLDIGIYPEVLDRIGATSFLITGRGVRKLLPHRPPEAHKGSFGHVL